MSTEEKNKHGVGAFVLAGISFIPLIGIFTGVICIIIAAIGRKTNSRLLGFLGFAGIIFSVVLYGSMFYKLFQGDGLGGKNFEPHAISAMTSLVRNIEYIKLQSGSYPKNMEEVRGNLKEGEIVFSYDVSGPMKMGQKQRDFHYEVINNGNNYLLFGVGLDAEPFTQDDIYPLIDPVKDQNIGWVKSK
ncbi:MAG: hypothetical protein C0625_13495 [Arcobacter sp.]|nr:MAG: hypothetical protein C0625_13495 [Arcobacter sp.]